MSISVPALQVTLDVGVTDGDVQMDDRVDTSMKENSIYCGCQSDYCDCGSDLGVTEAAAAKVYKHLGFKGGRDDLLSQDYRPCALHIWGTHNLSTDDVLKWLSDYNPMTIEWINDASCNVVFSDENTVLRIIVDFAEPFDRHVALAAAAALASLINSKEEHNLMSHSEDPASLSMKTDSEDRSLTVSSEALDSIEEFSQYLPPTGRWYKALAVPSQTISLFLRFAHKTDVKMPGAERRSLYYRRYGNPNYGGMTGILTRSYRRRLRTARKKISGDQSGDLRYINVLPNDFAELIADAYEDFDDKEVKKPSSHPDAFNFHVWDLKPNRPAPDRSLVVYDNLYDDDTSSKSTNKPHTGQRRNANVSDFPAPKSPKQPRKWPRRDRGPAPNRWLTDDYEFQPPRPGSVIVLDPREPWGEKTTSGNAPFIFSGSRSNNNGNNGKNLGKSNTNRYRGGNSRNHITTITMMPDSDSDSNDKPVYEEDENALRTRRLLASMTMVADLEEETSKHRSIADRLGTRNKTTFGGSSSRPMNNNRKGSVWQRLG